jgi:hypothetical protein
MKSFYQIGMDWICKECRREGTRWFSIGGNMVSQGSGSAINVSVGLEEEQAEIDHFLKSGCKGQVKRQGFALVRPCHEKDLEDSIWLEVCSQT